MVGNYQDLEERVVVSKKLLLVLFFLGSCSFMAEKGNEGLIKLGFLKSVDNQDYGKILKEGRKLLFGHFKVTLDEKDVTKYCLVGLNNSYNRRAVILWGEKVGDAFIDVKDQSNSLYIISCVRPGISKKFTYFLKESPFSIRGKVNYFGRINLNFSSIENVDNYRKKTSENYNSPWLKSVSVKYDEVLRIQLEERYNVKSDETVSIIVSDL